MLTTPDPTNVTPAPADTKPAQPEQTTLEAPALAQTLAEETPEAEAAPAAPKPRKRGGFAAMDRARVREIAHRGGLASHASGKAHRFTHEEAREAGRKGGSAAHRVRGPRRTAPASTE